MFLMITEASSYGGRGFELGLSLFLCHCAVPGWIQSANCRRNELSPRRKVAAPNIFFTPFWIFWRLDRIHFFIFSAEKCFSTSKQIDSSWKMREPLSLSQSVSLSHSFSNSHTHLHNLSLPLTYPHSLSIFHSLSLSLTLSPYFSNSLFSLSLSLSHSHSHLHNLSHTHSHSLSLSLYLSHTYVSTHSLTVSLSHMISLTFLDLFCSS